MELSNKKHELFCLEFARTGNASKSYKAAYGDMKESSLYSNGNRLLRNDRIKARIEELSVEMRRKSIADAAEIQEILTRIARQEQREEVVVVEGVEKGVTEARIVYKRPSNADAVKAAQTLARMQGAFDLNVNMTVNVPVFEGEESLED